MKQYGKAIKSLRKKADMTQAQLAQKLNVSAQTVSKWENEINLPDIFVIEKICSLFGVAMEEFVKLAENDGQSPAGQSSEEITDIHSAPPSAERYAASAAKAAPARPRDKRLWIIIVAAVLGSIVMLASIIVPAILLFSNSFGFGKGVYEKVNPSVFCITVQTENDTMGGSGFFIDKKGTAVTNYHVIEGLKSAKVKLYDGKEYDVDKIIGHDTVRDIAIIHVDINKSAPVSFADSNKIKTGDKVYAIGYPQSFVLGSQDSTFTDGIISKTSYSLDGVNYIQSNVDITHGNSGGVLLNAKGEVIGMTTAIIDLDNITYMNLSIPSNTIKSVKQDINLSVAEYCKKYGKKISVTYMLDGKQYAEKSIYAAESVPELSVDVTALGNEYSSCQFLGWYSDENFNTPFDFTTTADGDITLYAKLRFNTYSVVFTGGSDATGYVRGQTLGADESLTLPENGYTRRGYNFVGWKVGGKVYGAGDTVTFDGGNSILKIEAEWRGITYTVVFEYEGQYRDTTYRYGIPHSAPYLYYTREGYQHVGWTYNGKTYGFGDSIPDLTDVENATVVLAAEWTPIKYKIQIEFGTSAFFDGYSFGHDDTAIIIGTYGEDPFVGHKDPYASGLEFDGWTVYSADGQIYDGDLRYVNADPRVTIRAKANWVSGRYALALLKKRNDFDALKVVILEGREEFKLPLYSSLDDQGYSKGFHLTHWAMIKYNDDWSQEKLTFEDGAIVSDLMMLSYSSGGSYDDYDVDYFVEIFAEFEPNEYTVSFDGNGGQGSMDSLSCLTNKSYILPDNEFVKTGYTFAGWQYGDKIYEDGGKIRWLTDEAGAVVTLTARWIKSFGGDGTAENPYKISDYEQLKNVADAVENVKGGRTAYYELTADIDCAGGELYAIGYNKTFRGVFDGKGHLIKNATFAATFNFSEYPIGRKGLFYTVFGGQIANVGLKDYVIDGVEGCTTFAPLVCSYMSDLPLQNCFAEGTISWEDAAGYFAGLVYELCSRAVNCYSVCTIDMKYTHSAESTAFLYIGGFLGRVGGAGDLWVGEEACSVTQSFAENCYADARINISVAPAVTEAYYHRMGLFSAFEGSYKNCFATGEITYDCGYDFVVGIRSGVNLFSGNLHFNDCENVYVADDAKITFTDKVITEERESVNRTDIANLCSLEWLKSIMSFDETVWKENGALLPALKQYD